MTAGTDVAQDSPPAGARRGTAAVRAQLRVAAVTVGVLALAGAVLGLAWAWWSPPGPAAEVLSGGRFVPDETEAFIAGDGRFLVLTAGAGLVAALLAWFLRRRQRGPLEVLGLAAGAVVGALLTDLLGHLAGGGSDTGKVFSLSDGSAARVTRSLTLSVHAHGLLLIEPLVVVLVYGLLASFTERDDLGHPDGQHPNGLAPNDLAPNDTNHSVEPGGHAKYGGGYGDAAGALQQGDLAPQQPRDPA